MKTAAEDLVCLDTRYRKPIAGDKPILRHRCNPQKTCQLNEGRLPQEDWEIIPVESRNYFAPGLANGPELRDMKLTRKKVRWIIRQKQKGVGTKEIAREMKISRRRVQQIWKCFRETGKEPVLGKNLLICILSGIEIEMGIYKILRWLQKLSKIRQKCQGTYTVSCLPH